MNTCTILNIKRENSKKKAVTDAVSTLCLEWRQKMDVYLCSFPVIPYRGQKELVVTQMETPAFHVRARAMFHCALHNIIGAVQWYIRLR